MGVGRMPVRITRDTRIRASITRTSRAARCGLDHIPLRLTHFCRRLHGARQIIHTESCTPRRGNIRRPRYLSIRSPSHVQRRIGLCAGLGDCVWRCVALRAVVYFAGFFLVEVPH